MLDWPPGLIIQLPTVRNWLRGGGVRSKNTGSKNSRSTCTVELLTKLSSPGGSITFTSAGKSPEQFPHISLSVTRVLRALDLLTPLAPAPGALAYHQWTKPHTSVVPARHKRTSPKMPVACFSGRAVFGGTGSRTLCGM